MFSVGILIFHDQSSDINSACNPKEYGSIIGPLFSSTTKYKDAFVERADLSRMRKGSKSDLFKV